MKRRVIDAHLHLDPSVPGPAAVAVRALLSGMRKAGVERGVLLHLASQRWSLDEVAAAVRPHRGTLCTLANLDPRAARAGARLRRSVSLGFAGLKLHPRLERYRLTDPRTAALVREAGRLGLPTVIDAFPDGDWLMDGFDPLDFARLAKACPGARIVAAHTGGHRVLDLMMIAKRVPNLHLDLSYSLLYYRSSSVPQDMAYAMRSLRFEKVFYGSDYPDRPVDLTLRESLKLLREGGLSRDELDRVLYRNAEAFFRWKRA